MKNDERREIEDPKLREELIDIFNRLVNDKNWLTSTSRQLDDDFKSKNVYYIKRNLGELFEKMRNLNSTLSKFAEFIYGEGAVTSAFETICQEENAGLRQIANNIANTTVFDSEDERQNRM